MPEADSSPRPPKEVRAAVEARVLQIVGDLAAELGGSRARRAVACDASLERDLGLGSLERVELLLRLESAFDRALDDRFLKLDTPAELARTLFESAPDAPIHLGEKGPVIGAPAILPEGATTIHETLWRRAEAEGERPHVYMREDDGREHVITYAGLLQEASRISGGLQERGLKKGETVGIMLPTGLDFLGAFQGTLIAGGVPVPIYPPARLDRLEEYAARQAAILANAEVRILITMARAVPVAALLRKDVPSLRGVETPEELKASGAGRQAPQGSASDVALIQYTSGSTDAPKGVVLTHENLLANLRGIASALDVRPTDVGASWLPLYHDMGLIGSWLFCLWHGFPIDIQSPTSFLAQPERWLWAIHKRRATLSPAPNFAYELCVRKISERAIEGLDLSSWRCALNGAEPVSPETLERFARRFAPYGFRREALMPVYGLAENSVALCVPEAGRGPVVDHVDRKAFESFARAEPAQTSGLRFVSVGKPLPHHEVRILDEKGAVLPERAVGRLVFRGPSATQGYFKNPEATATMRLEGGWLDGGDLAYRVHEDIYIAGRRKDLIIKAGRNLVPQEIEEVASNVEGIRKGSVVAFGVQNEIQGTESLVIVAETRLQDPAGRERLVGLLRERVTAAVGLPPDRVCLVAPGVVPKTSSGKIRRADTKRLFALGSLGRVPGTSASQRIRLTLAVVQQHLWTQGGTILRGLYVAYLTLALFLLALVVCPLILLLPGRRAALALGRLSSRIALLLAGCHLSAEGLEHLQGPGPFLLASNHASNIDVAALLALLPMDFLFVAKKEISSWPFIGAFIRKAGHLTVERWDLLQSVADAEKVARAVEAAESVLIFPEGTFTWANGLRPFRLGVFKTAVETGRPIVPMALSGTRQVLRGSSWFPRPGRIHLWIGRPIPPEGDGWRAVVHLRDGVAGAIAAHCGEPRLDLVAAGPVRS